MSLGGKLQVKEGQAVVVLHAPPGLELGLRTVSTQPGEAAAADAVLVFVGGSDELARRRAPLVEAARRDALAWIAYPKGGQLGTDLNRDSLARTLADAEIRPVRQVSLDDTWSALRFRPA